MNQEEAEQNKIVEAAEQKENNIFDTKISEWIEIPELFSISIIAPMSDEYRKVHISIIREDDNTPFDPHKYIPDTIPKENKNYNDCISYITEFFTAEEIKKISNYFRQIKDVTIGEPQHCQIPEKGNVIATKMIPVGGTSDFLMFSESPDYPLGDLKIMGYYDLRHSEKNQEHFICKNCGKVMVKSQYASKYCCGECGNEVWLDAPLSDDKINKLTSSFIKNIIRLANQGEDKANHYMKINLEKLQKKFSQLTDDPPFYRWDGKAIGEMGVTLDSDKDQENGED